MGRLTNGLRRAEDAHRQAAAHLGGARLLLSQQQGQGPDPYPVDQQSVARLDGRLAYQRERLRRLAGLIGAAQQDLPAPVPPAGDAGALLDAAERYADAADVAAAHVEGASVRPALLPGATPLSRSLVVYAACAGLALVVQMGLVLLADNSGGFSWSIGALMCTGLPAFAFFAGFGALTVGGRPAVGDRRPVSRHPRIGLAICLLTLPIALCGYLALFQVIRG